MCFVKFALSHSCHDWNLQYNNKDISNDIKHNNKNCIFFSN